MLLFSIQQTLKVFLFLLSGEHQDQLTLVGTLLGKAIAFSQDIWQSQKVN